MATHSCSSFKSSNSSIKQFSTEQWLWWKELELRPITLGASPLPRNSPPHLVPRLTEVVCPVKPLQRPGPAPGAALPVRSGGQLTHCHPVCSQLILSHAARHAIPSHGTTPHQPVQLLLHGKTPSERENSCQYPNFSFFKDQLRIKHLICILDIHVPN